MCPGVGGEPARTGYLTLEAHQVEVARIDGQHVARRPGRDRVVADRLAQPGDQVAERRRGGRRSLLVPELVDQAVARDDLVRIQKQKRQEGALLLTRKRDHSPPVARRLERTEDSELRHPQVVAKITSVYESPLRGRCAAVAAGLRARRTVAAWLPCAPPQRARCGPASSQRWPSSPSSASRGRHPPRSRGSRSST